MTSTTTEAMKVSFAPSSGLRPREVRVDPHDRVSDLVDRAIRSLRLPEFDSDGQTQQYTAVRDRGDMPLRGDEKATEVFEPGDLAYLDSRLIAACRA